MGLYGADDHCGHLGMTVHVWRRFSGVALHSNYLPHHHLSSVCCIHGRFRTAPLAGADQHQGQQPLLRSHLWCVQRSILDQYSLDNLTSAFNSVCPYLCFVSWLLIKWTPQDLTCRGRTQWWLGLQTQALVSLAIDPLSPHLSLPVISVSPPVMVLLSISNKKTSLFGGWAWNRHRKLK